jgi:hypothetical protein
MMSTTIERKNRAGVAARMLAAAVATVALTFGGVTAANAAPGDALVSGGPTLTVTTGYTIADTNTITVTGSGFDAATIAPSTGNVAGLYLNIGSVDTTNGWRPSADKPTTSRHPAKTIWVHPGGSGADEANLSGSTTTNGSFSVTFTVPSLYTKTSADTWAVYTIGANGKVIAGQEQAREINYTSTPVPAPTTPPGTPTLSVNYNDVTEKVTISGSGYTSVPAFGIYVSVGTIDTTGGWKPSAGKGSSTRVAADTLWTWSGGPSTPAGGIAKLNPDGTFSVTLSTASLPATPPTGHSYAVYTIGAHGSVSAGAEQAWIFVP